MAAGREMALRHHGDPGGDLRSSWGGGWQWRPTCQRAPGRQGLGVALTSCVSGQARSDSEPALVNVIQ